jgi:hypothetical protein
MLVRPGHQRPIPARQSDTWEPRIQILSPRPFEWVAPSRRRFPRLRCLVRSEVGEARSPSDDFAATPTAQPTISSRSSRPRSKSARACVFRQLKL